MRFSCKSRRIRLRHLLLIWSVLTVAGQGLAQGCEGWNTSLFFLFATPAEVESCLTAGADLNARTIGLGYTPLHWAVWFSDDPAVIEALLEAGADATARNEGGATPLLLAAQFNNSPAIITALIDAGSDLGARDNDGATSLHIAAQFNNSAVVTALVAAGADATARDEWGRTPWDLAQENGALRDMIVYWQLNEGRFR